MNLNLITLDPASYHSHVARRQISLLVLPTDKCTAVLVGGGCSTDRPKPNLIFADDKASIQASTTICCPCAMSVQVDRRKIFAAELQKQCAANEICRVILACPDMLDECEFEGIELISKDKVDPKVMDPFTFIK